MEKDYYVCTGCGLLCDDIEVELEKNAVSKVHTACRVGVAHMKESEEGDPFKLDGKASDEASSIKEAVSILKSAKNPLIYGLGNSSNEAQKLAIGLARKLNATLDDSSSFSFGPAAKALLGEKFRTCTLDDVRNKADVIVFWGADPSDSHPRLLSKFAYFPRGEEKQRGWEEERTAICVDVMKSHTAKICGNYFFQIPHGGDAEFIAALESGLSGKIPKTSYNFPPKRLLELANILKGAKFGVIFIGSDLLYSLENPENLFNFLGVLNEKAKGSFNLITLFDNCNMLGFNKNLFAETGYINSVKFEDGGVKHGPEYSIIETLKTKTADAALIIGEDPLADLPFSIIKNLLEIPIITISPHKTFTSRKARVSISTALDGVKTGGSAARLDGVEVKFRPVTGTDRLSDAETLTKLMEAL
jgi:formylmethanofuran dehydrogenase subunit B